MSSIRESSKASPARKAKEGRGNRSCQRFLDAAEYLFAEYGYEGTKIRAIAERSGVNLGALHHYWGSKEELYHAVCERRLQPANAQRMRRYDVLEAEAAAGGEIGIRDLIRASIEPSFFLEVAGEEERRTLRKFYGRAIGEPSPVVDKVMRELFTPVTLRFLSLLRGLCPHLGDDEFHWRANCILGAFLYVPAFSGRMCHYAPDFAIGDVAMGIDQTVAFLAAGMAAPSLLEKQRSTP